MPTTQGVCLGLQSWRKKIISNEFSVVIATDSNLGQGMTLDESTSFGQMIKNLDFTLDWISSGDLLSSTESTIFDDELQLWVHRNVTLRKDFNFQENKFLSGEVFPATVYSSFENFQDWNFNISSNTSKLIFSLPSQFTEGDPQLDVNVEVGSAGTVERWSTKVSAEDFDLDDFSVTGNKILVNYDGINDIYEIQGRFSLDGGIIIRRGGDYPTLSVENLTFNDDLQISTWSVAAGATLAQRISEIGFMKGIPFPAEYSSNSIKISDPISFDGLSEKKNRFTLLTGEITLNSLEFVRSKSDLSINADNLSAEATEQNSTDIDNSEESTDETSGTKWQVGSYGASGTLAVQVPGFNIASDVNLEYNAAGTNDQFNNVYDSNTVIIKDTDVTFAGDSPSIFDSKATIEEIVVNQTDKGDWKTTKWSGNGKISVDTPGIDTNSKVDLAYYMAGTAEGDTTYNSDTIISSGTFSTGDNSLFRGRVEVENLTFEEVINEDSSSGGWQAKSWSATGKLNVDVTGLPISGGINASYYKAGSVIPEETETTDQVETDDEITNDLLVNAGGSGAITNETILTSGTFKLPNKIGVQDSIFSGQVEVHELRFTRNLFLQKKKLLMKTA